MTVAIHTDRVHLNRLQSPAGSAPSEDGEDVTAGLTAHPKSLPCKYLYDEAGSLLFERICETPEYYPTRTERRILEDHADAIAALTGAREIVELGSGSASKTRILLDAYDAAYGQVDFTPIDISEEILVESAMELAKANPRLNVKAYSGTYGAALAALHARPETGRLFLFLGSTIGNFTDEERTAFLRDLRRAMQPGDFFLLGIDRQKDPAVIEAAYNDAAGLTAAFNLNILNHLNARFEGDFRPDRFRHVAFYDTGHHRIEMHLQSQGRQTARLAALDLDVSFADTETIRTEISRKFNPDDLGRALLPLGLEPVTLWSDPRDWFALMLFAAADTAR